MGFRNKEQERKYQKNYRLVNKTKLLKYNIEYKLKNKEKIKKDRPKYREKNVLKIKKQVWAHKLKSRYGLTPEQYMELMRMHGESCAICATKKDLNVDHDHATNKVRGILCGACNRGLGLFRDNVTILQRAIDYLEKNI